MTYRKQSFAYFAIIFLSIFSINLNAQGFRTIGGRVISYGIYISDTSGVTATRDTLGNWTITGKPERSLEILYQEVLRLKKETDSLNRIINKNHPYKREVYKQFLKLSSYKSPGRGECRSRYRRNGLEVEFSLS